MGKMNFTPRKVLIKERCSCLLGLLFHKSVQILTLIEDTVIDTNTITVSAESQPLVNNLVCIKDGLRYYQGIITSIAIDGENYIVTLNTLVDSVFSSGVQFCEATTNLAVDGSTTAQVFRVSPRNLTNVTWSISSISGSILDQSAMDDSKFGGIPELDRGVLLRFHNGETNNLSSIRNNSDFKLFGYKVEYSAKAPAGYYGLSFIKNFGGDQNNGSIIRLNSDTEDELQVIVQDDLSDLDLVQVMIHGHVVEN